MSLSLARAQARARKAAGAAGRTGRLVKAAFWDASNELCPVVPLAREAEGLKAAVPKLRAAVDEDDDDELDFEAMDAAFGDINRHAGKLTRGTLLDYKYTEVLAENYFVVSDSELVEAMLERGRREVVSATFLSKLEPKEMQMQVGIQRELRKRGVPLRFADRIKGHYHYTARRTSPNLRVVCAPLDFPWWPEDTEMQPRPPRAAMLCPSFPPSQIGALAAVCASHDITTLLLPEMFATHAGASGTFADSFATIDAVDVYQFDNHAAVLRAFHTADYAVCHVSPTASTRAPTSIARATRQKRALLYISGTAADRADPIPKGIEHTVIGAPQMPDEAVEPMGAVDLLSVALARM